MPKIITTSEQETFVLAKSLAKAFHGGEVIGLVGDLGAGKTIFAKGIAAGLGLKENINSPTFVLMKVYDVKKENIKKLVHVDAYRIKLAKDLTAIGLDEYLNRLDAVVVIEWADQVKKILPKNTKYVKIKINNNQRIINF